jgi:hypothetical protein
MEANIDETIRLIDCWIALFAKPADPGQGEKPAVPDRPRSAIPLKAKGSQKSVSFSAAR